MNLALYHYSGAGNMKFIAKKLKKKLEKKSYQVEMIHVKNRSILSEITN